MIRMYIAEEKLKGTSLPKKWWFAYREHDVAYSVFYLIPFNLVVRYALKLYWTVYSWVVWGGWKDKLDDAYRRGYNAGNTSREHHYDRLARTILGKD